MQVSAAGIVKAPPALVLNADFRPLSYFPLSVWSWQDTVRAVFLDRVNVVEEYDQAIHSPSMEMKLPSVIALKEYVPLNRRPKFTRFNVFLRDNFTCQYSGAQLPAQELTFDHVIPRSRGGTTCWTNIVTCSQSMNLQKGDKLLRETDLRLMHPPQEPTMYQLMHNGKRFPPNYLHDSWQDYLYWDSELEADAHASKETPSHDEELLSDTMPSALVEKLLHPTLNLKSAAKDAACPPAHPLPSTSKERVC